MELIDRIRELSHTYFDEVVSIRRYLHSNPELSFEEFNTSDFVQKKLTEYGISFTGGFVKTGIVATIEGNNPNSNQVILRADLDALPINEENACSYRSNVPNVMHACGHDVHTASLLGASKILSELREQFSGTIKLIFQPGEEKLPGGAKLMMEEGALDDVKNGSIIGQHVYPELDSGMVGFRKGMYMASSDELYITVSGTGGHAALPNKVIDPILIASHILVSLQQIVSRNAQPDVPTVLSFGKIIADGATNVIPKEVRIEGTFRTMDEEWRKNAHIKMREIAMSMAKGMGGDCDFEIRNGYPCLINDEKTTQVSIEAAQDYLGKDKVVDLDLRMTSEDFAYYSQKFSSCFYRLGVRNIEKNITSGLHTSTFDIDEEALKTGMGLMAYTALKQLKK